MEAFIRIAYCLNCFMQCLMTRSESHGTRDRPFPYQTNSSRNVDVIVLRAFIICNFLFLSEPLRGLSLTKRSKAKETKKGNF